MIKSIIFTLSILFSSLLMGQNSLPNLSLKSINNKSVDIKNVANEDELIVYSFWATWCAPCIKELDAISEVYEEWQDEINFKLIAVSTDNARTVSRVKPLVNGKAWDYDVLLDTNQEFKRAIGANAMPYLIIVKNNIIVYKHSGYTPGSEIELFEKLEQLSSNKSND